MTLDSNTANELRVGSRTPTNELASAIAHAIYDQESVTLRAIGAGAVNQGVKALAIAQGYAAQRGITMACRPGFVTTTIEGQERTAIVFRVFTIG